MPKTAYKIRGWDELYENNRTRRMKFMQWIPVPNKHDGDGYIQLVDGPESAEMLGAWLAILQVASKCPIRGKLVRGSGQPHDAESISTITRIPAESIQKALDKCSSRAIGWLEIFTLPDVKLPPEKHPPGIPDKTLEGHARDQDRALSAHSPRTLGAPDCPDPSSTPSNDAQLYAGATIAGACPPPRTLGALSAHPTDEERNGTERNGRERKPPIPLGGEHDENQPGEDDDGEVKDWPAFRAAWEAFDRWSLSATKYPLRLAVGEERHVWKLIKALNGQPPIIHGGAPVPQCLLIPKAADVLMAKSVDFRKLPWACKCVLNLLDEWAKTGMKDAPPTVDRFGKAMAPKTVDYSAERAANEKSAQELGAVIFSKRKGSAS
jgi:hypothetical protein